MKILIAIPVINLWSRYTEECLKSIQCKYEHQIMIIDNHSQDETQVKMLELSGQDKKYLYIRNEESKEYPIKQIGEGFIKIKGLQKLSLNIS